ncbi:carboxymuconolactone decarboxylase family protein [Streptomyces sp. NBC_01351]|uniref:carboxymuconolactone decarboxylase family protein n=1 Tax=Streptomyces sp. NBC_01351 TaxID=2903833 RepID=UPI002E2F7921|nr:carboxymuconolactone decarboxylase family protein [Streptomyces sp. NBC_01351]
MGPRLNVFGNATAGTLMNHFASASKAIKESSLPVVTQDLVALRVSQINGCGFCVDMHSKDAYAHGEVSVRLHLVAAWREATVFTEAERAALELAEQGTRIADGAGGVTDEVWANAAKHYDEDQLVALINLIALMNTFNRLNVMLQIPAGEYQPGQFD